MKKVELLAPAGNLTSVYAAINAGADAIYMGASKFSARAYADNLSDDEFVTAIYTCHLHNVKVYLTLNTLLKDDELAELKELLDPLYNAGLDGVIIQDLGVAQYIKNQYPELKLHASTQMSIMNSSGAKMIAECGFERVVPARELSLNEIQILKNETGIELECFIHGAMCYSYSGLCLMSSIIGGRSGNRGRCAGTCRLPFKYSQDFSNKEQYPLSMKDLCTIHFVPDLIEAGIDSFKIEGRMKSPVYVAGVVAMYRKYIDLYYENGRKNYSVSKEDLNRLEHLYTRTEIFNGYLFGDKGKQLLAIDSPGYNGNDAKYVEYIEKTYIKNAKPLPITINAFIISGSPLVLNMSYKDVYVSASGSEVEHALNKPVDPSTAREKIAKLGATSFFAEEIDIDISDDAFVPVRELNEVRRQCCELLQKEIIKQYGFDYDRKCNDIITEEDYLTDKYITDTKYEVLVTSYEQLQALYNWLSINADNNHIERLYVDYDLAINYDLELMNKCLEYIGNIYISLPFIYRHINTFVFDKIAQLIKSDHLFKGVLVHTLDEVAWARKSFDDIGVIADTSIYVHNSNAISFIKSFDLKNITLPYELKLSDLHKVVNACNQNNCQASLTVYGRIPMMISAGCIKKTYNKCDNIREINSSNYILDRNNHKFIFMTDCNICTNVIYNDRPLNLYKMKDKIDRLHSDFYRISFIDEKSHDVCQILEAFLNSTDKGIDYLNNIESTTGHIKRGAE